MIRPSQRMSGPLTSERATPQAIHPRYLTPSRSEILKDKPSNGAPDRRCLGTKAKFLRIAPKTAG